MGEANVVGREQLLAFVENVAKEPCEERWDNGDKLDEEKLAELGQTRDIFNEDCGMCMTCTARYLVEDSAPRPTPDLAPAPEQLQERGWSFWLLASWPLWLLIVGTIINVGCALVNLWSHWQ